MGINRTDILNHIAELISARNYLEVGVNKPDVNYDNIRIEDKTGVDIKVLSQRPGLLEMTSDSFFKDNIRKFDLIFIDGDHDYAQCYADVLNGMNVLSEKGVLVMHDMCPKHEDLQLTERVGEAWYGEAWKVFASMRMSNPMLFMVSMQDDCGCGIIKWGRQITYPQAILDWPFLEEHRKYILNQVFTFQELDEVLRDNA